MSPEFKHVAEAFLDEVLELVALQQEPPDASARDLAVTRQHVVERLADLFEVAVRDVLTDRDGRVFSGARSLTRPPRRG